MIKTLTSFNYSGNPPYDLPFIRPPRYYGHFILARTKAQSAIFLSLFKGPHHVNKARFLRPVGERMNGVRLHFYEHLPKTQCQINRTAKRSSSEQCRNWSNLLNHKNTLIGVFSWTMFTVVVAVELSVTNRKFIFVLRTSSCWWSSALVSSSPLMSSATSLYDCNINTEVIWFTNSIHDADNKLALNMHAAIFLSYLLPLQNILLLLIWSLQKLHKVFSSKAKV